MSHARNHPRAFLLATLLISGFFCFARPLQAAIVDSDQDGLSDSAETQVYQTDPHKADTDGDGVPDGQEIVEGTNPLDPQDSTLRSLEIREVATANTVEKRLLWVYGFFAVVFVISLFRLIPAITRTVFPPKQ